MTWLPRSTECAAPGISQAKDVCDHERYAGGGAASSWKMRYAVRLTVPRRATGGVPGERSADFERALNGGNPG